MSPTPIAELVADTLSEFKGGVHMPGTEGYVEAVAAARSCNNCAGNHPALVLAPLDTDDVVLAVCCASEGERRQLWRGGPPLTVCGGGHSELCVYEGALLLQMSNLDSVSCDAAAQTVTLGAGARLGAVGEAAQAAGLAAPIGTWATVGVGSILLGGMGHLSRSRGVSADNVIEVEIVLADGTVKRLTSAGGGDDDAELLWGVRGCAPQFCIVTRLVLRAAAVSGARWSFGRAQLLAVDPGGDTPRPIVRGGNAPPAAMQAAVRTLSACESTCRALLRSQTANLHLGWAPPLFGASPTLMLGTSACTLVPGAALAPEAARALHILPGPLSGEEVEAYWPHPAGRGSLEPPKPPAAVAEPSKEETEAEVALQSSGACLSYCRTIYVDELGPKGMQILARVAMQMPSPICAITLQHGGGATREPPTEELAGCFACRRWEWSVLFMALWEDHEEDAAASAAARAKCMEWADGGWDALLDAGLATGCYPADIDNGRRRSTERIAREVALAYGSEALRRLRALKSAVDPGNLFRAAWSLGAEGD
jgi:hypothetical protein